jgi:thiol-disulfide isomerase/thioredoxin
MALPWPLLLTLAAIGVGWLFGSSLGRAARVDTEPLLTRMLLVGVLAARLAFVWQWRAAYLDEPWTMLDIRDGGWEAAAGFVAAAAYGLYRAQREAALRRPALAAVLAAGLVWTVGTVFIAARSPQAVPLPALSLPALDDGRPVALAGFAGKPTVINLWASWCPPCRREMPVLQQAQAAHPDLNLVFVNQGETRQTIADFLAQQQLKLDNVLVDSHQQTGRALGQSALPTTLFFDARGRLVSVHLGALSAATLAQRLVEARTGTASKGIFQLR